MLEQALRASDSLHLHGGPNVSIILVEYEDYVLVLWRSKHRHRVILIEASRKEGAVGCVVEFTRLCVEISIVS